MNTKLWIIVGVTIVVLAVLWVGFAGGSGGVPVKAVEAKTGPITEFVDERGKTRLPKTYLITMPYAGRIEPIAVQENEPVGKGQVVAQIVAEDLKLAVDEAQAGLQQATASVVENQFDALELTLAAQAKDFVTSMQAMVSAAYEQAMSSKAQLDYAIKSYDRTKRLNETGARTDDELDEAILEKARSDAGYRQSVFTHTATKAMDAATAKLPDMINRYIDRKKLAGKVLEAQRDRADVVLRQTQLDNQRGMMKSPVDGIVLARHVTNQRALPAGDVLLEIGRLEDIEVEADILSLDLSAVKVGQPVEIYGPAIGPKPAKGTVERIYPAGFTKISSLGVEQQRVKVIVSIDPADLERLRSQRGLGVAYRVRVRIFTNDKDKALVVPRSALFRGEEGQWQLFAIRAGRAVLQDVKVGLINDEFVEIVEGVKAGEKVILAPESNLEDGVKVSAEGKKKA